MENAQELSLPGIAHSALKSQTRRFCPTDPQQETREHLWNEWS
jgi:hypothetical protein